ncbi:MAG: hypothetical protein ABSB76_38480 [Streptosporangiaceae bacterium]
MQGPPDQMLCTAANGSFLVSGVCVLPDAVAGTATQQGGSTGPAADHP